MADFGGKKKKLTPREVKLRRVVAEQLENMINKLRQLSAAGSATDDLLFKALKKALKTNLRER